MGYPVEDAYDWYARRLGRNIYDEPVRGAGDHMTVGERIAFYRRRRGLTQAVLAGLVGRSEDWVSKIERGEREARRVDVLADVAKALRINLSDIFGQPVLVEDEEEGDDVPAVRDALMAPRCLSRILYEPRSSAPTSPESSSGVVEQAWSHYQSGHLGRVIAELPNLIHTAQALEDGAEDNPRGRACWSVSARTHHLASTTLSKIGEADLAWIAAERAMAAAENADDPLVLASAARAGTHAFLANGRYDDAVNLGSTAASWVRDRINDGDPAALSLFGMLHLRTAVAAARRQDRSTAAELLQQARRAAEALGEDANHWQTGFGPTNVQLHQLSASLDLGDVSYVVDKGPHVDITGLAPERAGSHLIDLARAMSLAGHDEALGRLLEAEELAPQLVWHSPVVRETVKDLHRRTPVAWGKKDSLLLELMERCRATQ